MQQAQSTLSVDERLWIAIADTEAWMLSLDRIARQREALAAEKKLLQAALAAVKAEEKRLPRERVRSKSACAKTPGKRRAA